MRYDTFYDLSTSQTANHKVRVVADYWDNWRWVSDMTKGHFQWYLPYTGNINSYPPFQLILKANFIVKSIITFMPYSLPNSQLIQGFGT
jgi:sensor domain CHASE-containing protein